jgi:hypothetical protein
MKTFISFATPDHRLVHVLSGTLTEAGITPLVAALRFSPGRRLEDKVRDMIAGSDCVVVLNTVRASRNRWVQQEIGCAKAFQKDIIPLKTRTARLAAMLDGYEYHTFSATDPLSDFIRVAAYLRNYAEKRRLPVYKAAEIQTDDSMVLHLPHALVCPRCKKTDIHVFLCLLCGDWVCTECGETIPPTARADDAVAKQRRPRTTKRK